MLTSAGRARLAPEESEQDESAVAPAAEAQKENPATDGDDSEGSSDGEDVLQIHG